ncbi:uncharacterized protein LOC120115882 isoform X2 [Hibiscus syriacus]|uniref:uncharacterized protein LOC120115882 isoform X2 n=1 Tax=Hibiscus syriacus TaxID=106335 RepID=UPI001921DC22|nr:uncharacterized protein LOC120115882 isoform X2 [Hibiscus syriacus]
MKIDEGSTFESRRSSRGSEDHALPLELENNLQDNVADEKSGMTRRRTWKAPKGKGKGKCRKKVCRADDVDKPSGTFQQPDSAMELESQQQACGMVQDQANTKMKKLIPVRPRKRQSPHELLEETFDVNEAPEDSQSPEPTGKEKHVRVLFIIEKKSPPKVLKVLKDRLNRRMKNDEYADMFNCIYIMKLVMKHDLKSLSSIFVEKLDKIDKKWPARPDMIIIQKDLDEETITREWYTASDLDSILNELNDGQSPTMSDLDNILENMGKKPSKQATSFVKMLHRFEAIEQKIKESDKIRAKDPTKLIELGQIICGDEGVSEETLREKISTVCSSLFLEENITNKLPKDNILEEVSATELYTASPMHVSEDNTAYNIPGNVAEECSAAVHGFQFPLNLGEANATNESAGSMRKYMKDLKKELFDKSNIDVKVSDFHGLQDAINSSKDYIPDHLKEIAEKIEDDRGESTPNNDFYRQLLVLVSAATKEMEDLCVNELKKPILRKWAATFNLANLMQFKVPYFERLLVKSMHAYLSYSTMNPGSEN